MDQESSISKRQQKKSRARLLILLVFAITLLAGCAQNNPLNSLEDVTITSPIFSLSTEATPEGSKPAPEQEEAASGHQTDIPSAETLSAEEQLEEGEEQFLLVEEIIIGLLFVAALVGIAAHRLRVP